MEETLIFLPFEWRGREPIVLHGNVTVDISLNFLMGVTTVQSFSSIQKKSSQILKNFGSYAL